MTEAAGVLGLARQARRTSIVPSAVLLWVSQDDAMVLCDVEEVGVGTLCIDSAFTQAHGHGQAGSGSNLSTTSEPPAWTCCGQEC